MAILHGSWLLQPQGHSSEPDADPWGGYFFVWGETWRRIEPTEFREASAPFSPPPCHPFAMTAAELLNLLRSLQQSRQLNWQVNDFSWEQTGTTTTRQRRRGTAPTLEAEVNPATSVRWQTISCTLPTYQIANASDTSDASDPAQNPAKLTLIPQHSAADVQSTLGDEQVTPASLHFQTWSIPGVRLTASEAIELLQSLSLSSVQDEQFSWQGADLRFWSHE